MSKHCRIFQWVEDHDPDFAAAIRQVCLEGALAPNRATPAVTFLYPDDKAYRAEIVDKAFGAKNDPDAAAKLIEALIVPDALLKVADFTRRPVGNRLGVAFAVKKTGNERVELDGGVELVPSDFVPMAGREGSIAVWRVARGRLPQTGAAYTPPAAPRRPPRRGGRGGVAGGGAPPADARALRAHLAAEAEGAYARGGGDGAASGNPFLARVVSLLNWLRATRSPLLPAAAAVLDYEPIVSFYLLFEPYKCRGGDFLIPDDVLFGDGAWNCASVYGDAVAEFEAFFREGAGIAARDRPGLVARVDRVRSVTNNAGRQIPAAVCAAYEKLATANTVDGAGPVLADAALRATSAAKKLWQDEFRFTIHSALEALRGAPFSATDFAALARDICCSYPGDDYKAEAPLTCAASPAYGPANVAPRLDFALLLKFVNSTDFLYVPVAPDAVGDNHGSMNPTDPNIYNRNAVALAELRRTSGMHRAGLSAAAFQELRAWVGLHGALPADVSALAPAGAAAATPAAPL